MTARTINDVLVLLPLGGVIASTLSAQVDRNVIKSSMVHEQWILKRETNINNCAVCAGNIQL